MHQRLAHAWHLVIPRADDVVGGARLAVEEPGLPVPACAGGKPVSHMANVERPISVSGTKEA